MSEPSSPTPDRNEDPASEVARMIMNGLASTRGSLSSGTLSPGTAVEDTLQGSRTNATLHARRVSQRYHLTAPYARELEEYAAEDSSTRQLLHHARLLSIFATLNGIVTAAPAFQVEGPLGDNIKKICVAVLLSPKLDVYKGLRSTNRVLAVVSHLGNNLPNTFTTDTHIRKSVTDFISDELTQVRAKFKRSIKDSIKSKQSIYEAAAVMVKDTQCVVTVEICARLSLLRKVHEEPGKSDSKYWDYVDERLQLIKEGSSSDPEHISAFFTSALNEDHKRYGRAFESLYCEGTNPWQLGIDDAMERGTPTATTSPQPTVAASAGVGSGDD